MADETFQGVVFAMDIQDGGFGSIDTTIRDLSASGTHDETDGCVLGDKASGDAESGISLPTFSPVYREKKVVDGSYTEQADAFLRDAAEGLSISFMLQGNGATATPAAGEAIPDLGILAIWRSLGMAGANGANPVYEFTPEYATTYSTIKIFTGDLSYVFQDCVTESAVLAFEPGGNGVMTANFAVGSVESVNDEGTSPTVTYGFQASLAAPTVEGVNFTWGTGHPGSPASGFENLTVTITNSIDELKDSNVDTTGLKYSQTRRTITVDGTLYVDAADSDFDHVEAVKAVANTDNLSFQAGTAAGAAAQINAYKVEVNNLQPQNIKHNRLGTSLAVELSGAKATSTTAGTEFKFTYN